MKLKKIKLINWHIFTNHTIEINGNVLVTGENGTGKSTLMDAIYYVLSGGDASQFNKAASDGGQRNLKTYLRGKLGTENTPFLRTENSIIGYIILEYEESDGTNRVLGTEIEIIDQKDPKSTFFIIEDYSISDGDFIEKERVLDYSESAKRINAVSEKCRKLKDTQKDRRKEIGKDFFKLSDSPRFYDLLKNALAFKPINEVSTFVNAFLLPKDNVNLESLRQEIRSYQEINRLLEKEESKMKCLEGFIEYANKYIKNKETIRYLEVLKVEALIENYEASLQRIGIDINRASDKLASVSLEKERLQTKHDNLLRELDNLRNNEMIKVLNEKEERLKVLTDNHKNKSVSFDLFKSRFEKENKLCLKLKLNNNFQSDFRNKDYGLMQTHFDNYEVAISELKNKSLNLKAEAELKKRKEDEENKRRSAEFEELQRGISNYPEGVKNLIALAKETIATNFPNEKNAEVRPLCEYLEIKDEEWRNALEGYLGNQKFNLIINPKYYDAVSKEIDRQRDSKNIYISGIVNVTAIPERENVAGSLAEKVEASNSYAAKYISYLLGNIICVDDVISLKMHPFSITKNVLVYKNYVLKAYDPKKYEKPFIGRNSFEKRIEILNKEIQNSEKNINELSLIISENQDKIALCDKSEIKELKKEPNYWNILGLLENEITELENDIQESRQNQGILDVYEKCQKVENSLNLIKNEIRIREDTINETNQLIGQKRQEKNDYEKNRNELALELKDKKTTIDIDEYSRVLTRYKEEGNFKETVIKSEIDKAINSNNSINDGLLKGMHTYTNEYNSNLIPNVDNIKHYIYEYEKLKNRDIVHYKSEAKTAYERAEISFREDFISKLRDKIESSQKAMDKLNKNLADHPFGTDEEIYQFYYQKTHDDEFGNYFRIITSGKLMDAKDLFSEVLDAKDNQYMQDLFKRVSVETDSSEAEKELEKYLDYRNYMNYDIKIKNKRNDVSFYSKISREKSGGETQTPFYIVIAACFDLLMNKDARNVESTCQVVFDEAFNNMDESRIKSLMEFYSQLNIQLIIIAPSNRIPSIAPYVNTLVGIAKQDNYPYIFTMQGEEYGKN